MDIRHCFVPNLPGIITTEKKENEQVEETEQRDMYEIDKNEKNPPKKPENSEIVAMKKEEKRVIAKELEKEIEKGEEEVEKKVVIMAKHLCGVATDLALRSLESFKIRNSNKIGNFHRDLLILILFLFLLISFSNKETNEWSVGY
jgi:Methyltransferase TRM13